MEMEEAAGAGASYFLRKQQGERARKDKHCKKMRDLDPMVDHRNPRNCRLVQRQKRQATKRFRAQKHAVMWHAVEGEVQQEKFNRCDEVGADYNAATALLHSMVLQPQLEQVVWRPWVDRQDVRLHRLLVQHQVPDKATRTVAIRTIHSRVYPLELQAAILPTHERSKHNFDVPHWNATVGPRIL